MADNSAGYQQDNCPPILRAYQAVGIADEIAADFLRIDPIRLRLCRDGTLRLPSHINMIMANCMDVLIHGLSNNPGIYGLQANDPCLSMRVLTSAHTWCQKAIVEMRGLQDDKELAEAIRRAEEYWRTYPSDPGFPFSEPRSVLTVLASVIKTLRKNNDGGSDHRLERDTCEAYEEFLEDWKAWEKERVRRGILLSESIMLLPDVDMDSDAEEMSPLRDRVEYERRIVEDFFDTVRGSDPKSHCIVGHMYATETGIAKSDSKALKWYSLAAHHGEIAAQFNLTIMYQSGIGVPADISESLRWCRLAAEQGHPKAQVLLGALHAEGAYGAQQDYAEAIDWYRLASERGQPHAQFNLGIMYETGLGVPQSYIESYFWLSLAATSGEDEFAERRDAVASGLTAEQIAETQQRTSAWSPKS